MAPRCRRRRQAKDVVVVVAWQTSLLRQWALALVYPPPPPPPPPPSRPPRTLCEPALFPSLPLSLPHPHSLGGPPCAWGAKSKRQGGRGRTMTEEYTCVQLATIWVHEVVLMSDVVIPAGQSLVIYKQ